MKKSKIIFLIAIFIAMFNANGKAQSLSINGDSINCASPNYTLSNYVGGVTYTWSGTGGVTFSPTTGIASAANWAGFSGTSSTITVTGSDGTSATFIVYECCTPGLSNSFTNSTASAIIAMYTNVVYGRTIYINGTLTIDANIEFDNTKVYMGEHATIINSSGYTLKFTDNTQVQSPCNYMWDGIITTNNTAKVIVSDVGTNGTASPTIQDAFYAIVSVNGGEFDITNSNLLNNYRDIAIQAYSGTYNSFIKGSTLSCTRDLYAPYVNERTYCGITITELVANWTIGNTASAANKNTFNNMWYGIYNTKTNNSTTQNIAIYNNAFTKINPSYDGIINTAAGIAIVYSSNPSYTTLSTLTVGGTGTNQANTFGQAVAGAQDSYMGIECLRFTNTYINGNTFTNLAKGIYVDNVRGGIPIHINYNTMEEINPSGVTGCTGSWGISTLYTVGALQVENNNINYYSTTTSYQCAYGIENQTNQNAAGFSCSTTVSGNNIKQSIIAIYELTDDITSVTGNTIHIPSSLGTTAHYGIGIASCAGTNANNNYIYNNNITWDGGTPGSTQVNLCRGIQVQGSTYTQVNQNILTNCGSGIRCYGSGYSPNYLICNYMYYCYYGVYLDGGDIGNQNPSGIAWDNQWFDQVSPTYRVYGSMGGGATCVWYYVIGTNTSLGAGQTSVAGTFSTVSVGTGTGCTLKMAIYDPISSSEERQDFLGINSSIMSDVDISNYTDPSLYLMTKNAYEKIKADTSILYLGLPDDKQYQKFYQRVKSSNIGKLDNIKALIAAENYNAAIISNSFFTPLNTIEKNIKTVNDIFLHTWANEQFAFTSADSTTLMDIATQNPAYSGEGVYMARVLMQYFQTDYLNSSNMKIAHETPVVSSNSEILVYPNPASDNVTLQFSNITNENCTFELFDAMGNKIFSKEFVSSENLVNVSLTNVAKGVYICRIIDSNHINLYNSKLVIIK